MKPKSTVQNILEQMTDLRQTLIEMVKALPDSAEGIRKVAPNCAIVSFSTMAKHNNLSASYYMTNDTKQELISRISCSSPDEIKKLIEGVIESGRIKLSGMGMHRLPPNFLDALRKAWEQ